MPCNCIAFCDDSDCYCVKQGFSCYSACKCVHGKSSSSCENGGNSKVHFARKNPSGPNSKIPSHMDPANFTPEERAQGNAMAAGIVGGMMGGMGMGGMGMGGMGGGMGGGTGGPMPSAGFGIGGTGFPTGITQMPTKPSNPQPSVAKCCGCNTCYASECSCLRQTKQCGTGCTSAGCQALRMQQENLFREFINA